MNQANISSSTASQADSREPFHYIFAAIEIRWKLFVIIIRIVATRSQQMVAYDTTKQLSCHVQIFPAISSFEFWSNLRSVISIKFELELILGF